MSDPERPEDGSAADADGLVLPSAPTSVALARRYAADACVAHGWRESADTVALLVSEVATNAILHARGREVRVRVLDHGVRLRVEVVDDSPVLPVQRGSCVHAQDGHGLALVDALSVAWGVDGRPDGKTFWFEIGV